VTVRIGNCSGYYGDRPTAFREMLEGGELDYLTGDYLAELTMLILGKDRMKDPEAGYAKTFLRQLQDGLALAREKGVKVVANAGGLNPTQYKAWVDQVAKGLRGRYAMVVLEPDALALLGACSGQGDRTALLRYATRSLTRAGVWVYIDAGHSRWITPQDMAKRLVSAGVRDARGLATNTSNFRPTSEERTYGAAVVAELAKLGVKGKRYVVDTSRNGAAKPVTPGVWCNPPAARLGHTPTIVDRNGLDAYLWVKRPGESDGQCEGGPNAGTWWPTGARRLLAR
jgi:endoglucanase